MTREQEDQAIIEGMLRVHLANFATIEATIDLHRLGCRRSREEYDRITQDGPPPGLFITLPAPPVGDPFDGLDTDLDVYRRTGERFAGKRTTRKETP